MLAGRYATTRLRSLRPLLAIDRVSQTARSRPGAERLLYLSGGTIPDRGYFQLRLEGSGLPLGELDEEFVWERSIGDAFTLGVQTWRVERITHNDVFVSPAHARTAMAPFWRAEEQDRSAFLSQRVGLFLEQAETVLGRGKLTELLQERHFLDATAARTLERFLKAQRAATGSLPHRGRVIIERTETRGRSDHRTSVFHTLWGGRVNRPLSYALATLFKRRHGLRPEVFHDDDCVALVHPARLETDDLLDSVAKSPMLELLHEHLEGTGFFGARFREAAGCALILPRAGFGKRTPLWLNRQRAKELIDAVADSDDFPLVLEAWRTCLEDAFELGELDRRLTEVSDGHTEVLRVRTEMPSPFTANILWKQTNELMYSDDRSGASPRSRAHRDLVRELVTSSQLRPRIPRALIDELERKLQRTEVGYAPRHAEDLIQLVLERVAIPDDEWRELLAACRRDHDLDPVSMVDEVAHRLVAVHPCADQRPRLICAVEMLPRICRAYDGKISDLRPVFLHSGAGSQTQEALSQLETATAGLEYDPLTDPLEALLDEWLRFHGPITPETVATTLGLPLDRVRQSLTTLEHEQRIVHDELSVGTESREVCDLKNLERLLRLKRAAARPTFDIRPASQLPLLLADHQRLGATNCSLEDLRHAFEPLFGLAAAPELWETEILPARIDPYHTAWLDSLLSETDLEWFGCGRRRLAFALEPERDLFANSTEDEEGPPSDPFPQPFGRYSFSELLAHTQIRPDELTDVMWQLVWRGEVTSGGFAPVRQGIASGFSASHLSAEGKGRPIRARARFDRWRTSRPFEGVWQRIPEANEPLDPLEGEEQTRERARTLLDRYGVVFRELLDRELAPLRWSAVFRALRMLELAGEAVAGRFFDGVHGLQFLSHAAMRRLETGLPEDRIWWLSAVDPASPCGLGIEGLDSALPRRAIGNHVVFHGQILVLISEARGRRLTFKVAPDHPHLVEYLEVLRHQLGRSASPRRSISVETINSQPATASPYRKILARELHASRAGRSLRLTRRY